MVWANWQDPALHEFTAPVEFITLQTKATPSEQQLAQLPKIASTLPGVRACAVNTHTHCLTLVWQPDQLSLAALCHQLSARSHIPLQVLAPVVLNLKAAARQCPVPAGYVQLAERIRFALNLRRFFVHP